MTSNMKLQFHLILIVFLIGSAVRAQVPVGRSLNYNSNVPRTGDGVPILDRPYENSRLASQSTRRNPPTHDDQGLNLYEDFVNDPWKPTEDLGTLLSQRAGGRPQVRSGGRYDSADDIWSRNRQPYQRPSPVSTPVAAQPRPFTPVYSNEGNGYWAVSSRGDNHITYVRRDNYASNPTTIPPPTVDARGVETNWRIGAAASRSATNLRSNSDPPHGVNGDEDWIVESRSDGHITYRKRTRSGQNAAGVHGWRNPSGNTGIRTLGHGDGKVLARVVNTETDDAFASVHSGYNRGARTDAGTRAGLASYKSMKSNYAHENRGEESGKSHLQLKSGDYVSYRRRDGNEAVYNRYRQPSTTATPVHFEQEGDWRVVSKGDSHITWSRVGSEYDQSPRPSVSHRTGRYYGSGPQYPMMRERAFQERDSRVGGSQNVLVV